MNLEQMRAKFKEVCAGQQDQLSDEEINTLLNGAYQYTIPNDVPGLMHVGEWQLDTVFNQESYPYDATVVQVLREPPIIGSRKIRVYTRQDDFWTYYQRDDLSVAHPTGALLYARKVRVRPIPDAVYRIHFFCRKRPSALDDPGVDDRTWALATVYSAALEAASDLDDDELMVKLNARYVRQRELLKHMALSIPSPTSMPKRSF